MALLTLGAIFLLFLIFLLLLSRCSGDFHGLPVGERIGVVEITGMLSGSDPVVRQLVSFKKDDSIKAVILRVDSPGGAVAPSQEIHDEVIRVAAKKPVVVSMASVAASGGYYVSIPAHRIVANPGTITGSIGVIMQFTNLEELYGKLGLKSLVVKSGEHKDIASPFRPMTSEDRKILQGVIDDVYDQFVSAVAEGRNLSVEKVRNLADGRIFTGRQAKEIGLVDELGGMQDAVGIAKDLAGISGEPKLVYPPKDKENLLKYFVEESASQVGRMLQESQRTAPAMQYLWTGHD
ncbi:MAG: protease [Desulfuromonadales bacterium]|nr:protease [Desulfuromonadales bacterium]